jgi:N-acylglucosamine-6-phosphate 2-epimerase
MPRPVVELLRDGLVVSCQAPQGSPLDEPAVIAALALTAELNGAVGIRINSPAHIAAVRSRVTVPVIGIEKLQSAESEVYITPCFDSAERVARAGASIIALDATRRRRPRGETIDVLIPRVARELGLPVMADIATLDEGLHAAECGAEIVATTLVGYTEETRGKHPPDFELIEQLATRLEVPVICEGGLSSPDDVRRAFDAGAFAVVAGAAITGVAHLVRRFAAATRR